MALQSSGAISLANIQTEFGGTNPISLSEYYSKGNAPASGEIQLAADFYGTSNTVSLNLATHGTGTNSASISIGTARSTRMVHLSGYTSNGVKISSGTIGGVTATVLNLPSLSGNGFNANTWQAYAKVPTGTTATVSMNTACTYYITTFDTVNSGASATQVQSGTGTKTATLTASNPGVCFWGGNSPHPALSGSGSISTNSPGGATVLYTIATTNEYTVAAYNETSTTVSQTFSVAIPGGKIGSNGAVWSIFSAN
tara:strand:+ start:5020 stop:5784 length:765 start_codon:yes stop_codon:yes gene_type:complete